MELKTRILVYLGITILAISLFLVPVDVKGLTVTTTVTLDKSEYTVGEQPFVTVQDNYSDFDPNTIDTIIVTVEAKVTQSTVGTVIANVEIQETGPDTRIFSGVLPAISAEDMFNDVAQVENKWLEVSYTSGSKNSAYATLIQPPTQPEPEPETSEYSAGSNSSDCPQISNWLIYDEELLVQEFWTRLECNYGVPGQEIKGYLLANFATNPQAALGVEECSGEWKEDYVSQGHMYSTSHRIRVIYDYTHDNDYNLITSGAKSLLQQLESKNVAVPCPTQDQTGKDTEDTSEPKSPTQPEPEPESCPQDYPYLWSDGYCYDQSESEQVPEQSEYDSWLKQGSAHLRNGNFDEAIKYFDLAYKQNPNDQNLINLKAEALMEKGVALKHAGKYDLAVIYLGESNHLKKDEYVLALQNNAYNRWYESVRPREPSFDPFVEDQWKLLDPINYPQNPVVKEISGEGHAIIIPPQGGGSVAEPDTTLAIGDIIITGENSVKIDWGHVVNVLRPHSIFLVGNAEDFRKYEEGNPHYIEIIEGQLRLLGIENAYPTRFGFLLKVGNQPIEINGTDVIISRDKTTEISVVHIHEGTAKVFDDASNEIKEFGAGNTLVIKDVGVTQTKTLSEQTWDSLVSEIELPEPTPTQPPIEPIPPTTEGNGGCLIATAAFGSELAPQVQFLREIRDNTVLSTKSGTSFMTAFNAFYYSFSPTIANWERQNPAFKEIVKTAITPLITTLSILNYVDIDSEAKMIGYGIGVILLNIGLYFVAPVAVIWKLRSKFQN